jgi:hypothetical protein
MRHEVPGLGERPIDGRLARTELWDVTGITLHAADADWVGKQEQPNCRPTTSGS